MVASAKPSGWPGRAGTPCCCRPAAASSCRMHASWRRWLRTQRVSSGREDCVVFIVLCCTLRCGCCAGWAAGAVWMFLLVADVHSELRLGQSGWGAVHAGLLTCSHVLAAGNHVVVTLRRGLSCWRRLLLQTQAAGYQCPLPLASIGPLHQCFRLSNASTRAPPFWPHRTRRLPLHRAGSALGERVGQALCTLPHASLSQPAGPAAAPAHVPGQRLGSLRVLQLVKGV